jgi:HlyD family secretion protein
MKKFLLVLVLLASGVLGYYYYQKEEDKKNGPLVLYGNVDIRDLSLSFRVGGRIAEMRFEEGDKVETLEEVAILEKEPFLDEVRLREAQVREIEAKLKNAEKNFERIERLYNKGSVSESDYDNAKTGKDELIALLDTMKAQLKISETSLKDTILTSSNEGVILTKVREVGEIVGPGELVYSVALVSPVWIRAYVDEPDLGKLHLGQEVLVTGDNNGKSYKGQIGFISPKAEFTPKTVETVNLRTDLVYRLRIIVKEDKDDGLRQGMPDHNFSK